MADESTWWVIWHQPSPDLVRVRWIGPQPGPDPLVYWARGTIQRKNND
jgi:hypothetical protein